MSEFLCPRCDQRKASYQFKVKKSGRRESYCTPCNKAYKQGHYQVNREKVIARTKEWRESNPDEYLTMSREYYDKIKDDPRRVAMRKEYVANNREADLARKLEWRIANPEKTQKAEQEYRERNRSECNARASRWKKANPEALRRYSGKRRAALLRAIPAWANEQAVAAIYAEAHATQAESGVRMAVDHIVPLISDKVCGLHCEANLQILTASANSKKNNYWWPNMEAVL
jgi:hypothetical protein